MKKQFLLIVSLLATVGAFAQNGITNAYRFGQGEDSIKCLNEISLYSVNLRTRATRQLIPTGKRCSQTTLWHA